MKKTLPLLIFFITVVFFFKPFFFNNQLPIPADTIIGLYHPFRDLYAKDYPNGVPYKNFLITDPVRQQYPWRKLGIEIEKRGEMPLWNPYSMGGTPLAATLQGAVFYPLNILFFFLPFPVSWSLLIFLEPLLAGLFLYFYLKNLNLSSLASLFGSLIFAFSGFSIAWLEWGTLVHIALWLPLLLLAIDKIFHSSLRTTARSAAISNGLLRRFTPRNDVLWSSVFIFALSASLLAGHFQFFSYVLFITIVYFIVRWIQLGRSKNSLFLFIILNSLFLLFTAIQWLPTLQFLAASARDIDQANWQQPGWFIPSEHLLQFIAPDFFGNPTTLNYWGVWNYGELVGYVGIAPLIMSIFALFFRRDKKTFFFGSLFFLSLIFSLPTIFAELPYLWHIPFLSTSQPTRLLLITDFSLSVLGALGIDWFFKYPNKKQILFPLLFIGLVLCGLWLFVSQTMTENLLVAKHNLYFPSALFLTISLMLLLPIFMKNKKINFLLFILLLAITFFDLYRFGQKFTPFTNPNYLYPPTKILSFLQHDHEQFRIMSTDPRILPPNFSILYHLQSIDGYDPLYLRRYGELIAASERGKPDIHPPFGFNRIITPTNADTQIMDLLGVKYVLAFTDLPSPKFTKVYQEGQTKVYKNNQAFPRAFFVNDVKNVRNNQEAITALFDPTIHLQATAVVEGTTEGIQFGGGDVHLASYSENKIILNTKNTTEAFLVLTDTYYPTWHAKICSKNGSDCIATIIYRTDYNFRGIVISAGEHRIEFYNTLL